MAPTLCFAASVQHCAACARSHNLQRQHALPQPAGWRYAGRSVRAAAPPPPRAERDSSSLPDLGLPDLRLPKFQPFTPHNALRQTMLGFKHREQLPDGRCLLVAPLSEPFVPQAADLLSDSFAESLAAAPFRHFLRRQIKAYLEAHLLLPPKAIVLAAFLLPEAAAAGSGLDEQWLAVGSSGLGASSSTEGASSSGGGSGSIDGIDDGGSSDSGGSSSGSSTDTSSISMADQLGLGDGQAGMAPALGLDSLLSSSGSDASSEDDAAVAAAGMAAAMEAAARPGTSAELVAVLELSFSPSTRSKHLTLQPPEDRTYLCNMATHSGHRNRGYGLRLLQAAERLAAQLGEREIYLHLRVQDKPAERLYQKAGYQQVAADLFLVKLLGLDMRLLLRKVLPPPPSAA